MSRTRKPRTSLSKKEQQRVAKMTDTIAHNVKMDRRCQMDGCNNSAVLENLCDPCWQGYYQDVGGEDCSPSTAKALNAVFFGVDREYRDLQRFMWNDD